MQNSKMKWAIAATCVAVIGILVFRPKPSHASVLESQKEKLTTRGSNKPLRVARDSNYFSNGDFDVPAMALVYNKALDDYTQYSLNFTPRRASEIHNEYTSNDLQFFADPFETPTRFLGVDGSSHFIHPNDFRMLEVLGIIPKDFPLEQVAYVQSFNGKNEFLVGYSQPYTLATKREDVKVVRPLWAVSFGKDFDTKSVPPQGLKIRGFKDIGTRMLTAEGMLSRKPIGCHEGQRKNSCDLERGALLNALINRKHRKQEMYPKRKIRFKSVIDGPGLRWSTGTHFLAPYNGYPDRKKWKRGFPQKKIRPTETRRFTEVYLHRFWHLPQLVDKATHFVHYNNLSTGIDYKTKLEKTLPSWIVRTRPEKKTTNYPSKHTLHIGESIFTDRSGAFK